MSRNINFAPDCFYHIYNRGVDKRKIFYDENDQSRFVKLLYLANSSKSFNFTDLYKNNPNKAFGEINKGDEVAHIGAWCLMPNHFHILVKEPYLELEAGPQDKVLQHSKISIFMHKLQTGYSMYFNAKYQRKGALFEGNFKAQHIDSDPYLEFIYSYIHLNPIGIIDKGWKEKKIKDKAKAKQFLNDYEYSSYQDYSRGERDEGLILNKKEFPEFFSTASDFERMIDSLINFEEE